MLPKPLKKQQERRGSPGNECPRFCRIDLYWHDNDLGENPVEVMLTMENGHREHLACQTRSPPMEKDVIRWLRQGTEAYSYRRMYTLALDIRECSGQIESLNAAALRVIAILGPVIDHPIARAATLARADAAFWKMMIALACVDPLRQLV